jgi:hypothetical protein
VTGFFIPTAAPPAFETDGPLGSLFLLRALPALGIPVTLVTDEGCHNALTVGASPIYWGPPLDNTSHLLSIERVGPAQDGRCYSMRGRDVTDLTDPLHEYFAWEDPRCRDYTMIGIGDGGNEIGMGKIPHETIVKNIPNGDLIHCRIATDHLIVAGVSNWGAYALAAGVFVLRGVKPPADLFDPDREREILEVMVREGPLVDGVTGKKSATVDGLSWDEYTRPLVRIRDILES